MKTWIKSLHKKLASSCGESISEVLIAMLIIELALLMVVSMIMSAGNMITKSEKSFDSLYSRRNAMETHEEQTSIQMADGRTSAYAPTPSLNNEASVTITDTSGYTLASAKVTSYTVYYESDSSVKFFVSYEGNRPDSGAGSG